MRRVLPALLSLALLAGMGPAVCHGGQELLLGLIPEENIFRQMDRYRPLADYLSKKLGMKVRLTILSKYGDVIDRFVTRRIDGAFFEVYTSVLAMEELSAEPIARPLSMDGSSTIRSLVFVRTDSGIRTVADMRGKRMAFVDRATATGYLFALSYLKDQGVGSPDGFFKEYYFTGSHDSAIYSVLDNRADIGTASSVMFERMVEKDPMIRTELTVLSRSIELPGTTLCLRKDLSGEIKLRLQEALLRMDGEAEGREVLKKMGTLRFAAAGKDDFAPVFAMASKAGIPIKRKRIP